MPPEKRLFFVFLFTVIAVGSLFLANQISQPTGKSTAPATRDHSKTQKDVKEKSKKTTATPAKEAAPKQENDRADNIESIESPDAEMPHPKKEKKITDNQGYLLGKILPRKGLGEALMAVPGVTLPAAMEITNAIRFKVDLRILKAGELFRLKLSPDKSRIDEFIYSPDVVTHYMLKRNKKGKLQFSQKLLPTEKRYRIVRGNITTSLNQALIEREDVTGTIRAVTNNVLECIVNFRRDARKNDSYEILIEDRYYHGKKVPGSVILYVSYRGKRAGFHEAYKFIDTDPKSAFTAFYTPTGKALIPNALRLPVDHVHITSPFGWRIHPVTGRRAFHAGVDYGGPVGTPVYAVAKGVVTTVSQDRFSGRKIVIRHADGTLTYYLHLYRFLVRVGEPVKPRQKIGLMGASGRVTGPHLHFGIKSPSGKWLDPLKKHMIATPKLSGKRMKIFTKQMENIRWRLKHTDEIQHINNLFNEGPQPAAFYEQLPEEFQRH